MSNDRQGQALIESCWIMAILCLLLMGLTQLAQLQANREVLAFAAARGARARAVGFNDFMVWKTVRIGAIANAGPMLVPDPPGSPTAQRAVERGRIPGYLQAEFGGRLPAILNYEDWDTISWNVHNDTEPVLALEARQNVPIRLFPEIFRAFYGSDTISMRATARMDNHWPFYLH